MRSVSKVQPTEFLSLASMSVTSDHHWSRADFEDEMADQVDEIGKEVKLTVSVGPGVA